MSLPEDANSLWPVVQEELRSSLPESTWELWVRPIQLVSLAGDCAHLAAPDDARHWIERRYGPLIEAALRRHLPGLRGASFSARRESTATEEPSLVAELNPRYSFSTFVIGDGNRVAHGASLAVAEVPAQAYNPLFLYGPPGLGKTHLMGAIAGYLSRNAPGLRILYTTAESFTRRFTGALAGRGGTDTFKNTFRGVDVLLVDDVQFLQGKPRTEEELFHTFNSLYEAGSQIILSADRCPSELDSLADRLRDRFEWGLLAEVGNPDPATRLAILRKLAPAHGLEDPDPAVLESVSRLAGPNVRALEGSLTRVLAVASLTGRVVSPGLVSEVLGDASARLPSDPLERVAAIQARVAATLGLETSDLVGKGRSGSVSRARQLAMFLARDMTDLSLPEIGRLFGGRDHSTVHHAISRVSLRLADDPDTADTLERLRGSLSAPSDAPPDRRC